MNAPLQILTLTEVLELHAAVLKADGGLAGLRDRGLLESAIAQPSSSFDGVPLYPTLAAKVAALGFSLVMNHPFLDGNKRVGLLAMDVFLLLNGQELQAEDDDAETTILSLAAGALTREELTAWVGDHTIPRSSA